MLMLKDEDVIRLTDCLIEFGRLLSRLEYIDYVKIGKERTMQRIKEGEI